jgi:hypothetical protein
MSLVQGDTEKPKKQKTKATTRGSHDQDNVTNGTDMSLVQGDTEKPKKQKTKATTRGSHDQDNVTNGTDMSLVQGTGHKVAARAQHHQRLAKGLHARLVQGLDKHTSMMESKGMCDVEAKQRVLCGSQDGVKESCQKASCCWKDADSSSQKQLGDGSWTPPTEKGECFTPLPSGSMPEWVKLQPTMPEDEPDWLSEDRDRRASGEKALCASMNCKNWDFDCEHFRHRHGAKDIDCKHAKCTAEDFDTCCELEGKPCVEAEDLDSASFACSQCEANGYDPDGCHCGTCGSFGGCTWSCQQKVDWGKMRESNKKGHKCSTSASDKPHCEGPFCDSDYLAPYTSPVVSQY